MPPCAATVCERVGKTLLIAGGAQAGLRAADDRAQPGAAGADDDDVELMIGDRIGSAE